MAPGSRIITKHRYKVPVDRLCQRCSKGELTYADAAATHHPTVVLFAYMQLFGASQEELAERLKVSQATVSRVLDGTQKPSGELRQALKVVCSIPLDAWDRSWKAA